MLFSLQPIQLNQLEELQAIAKFTFLETFAKHNTAEAMQNYLDRNLSSEAFIKQLNHPNSQFFFARLDQQIIGYLKLNSGEAQTEALDPKAVEIERIYLSSAHQGKGLAATMMEFSIDSAKEAKAPYLWLGVWEHNAKAIAFYKKYGFEVFDTHDFWMGEDRQTDFLMRVIL